MGGEASNREEAPWARDVIDSPRRRLHFLPSVDGGAPHLLHLRPPPLLQQRRWGRLQPRWPRAAPLEPPATAPPAQCRDSGRVGGTARPTPRRGRPGSLRVLQFGSGAPLREQGGQDAAGCTPWSMSHAPRGHLAGAERRPVRWELCGRRLPATSTRPSLTPPLVPLDPPGARARPPATGRPTPQRRPPLTLSSQPEIGSLRTETEGRVNVEQTEKGGKELCYLDKGYFSLFPFFSFFKTFFGSIIKLELTVMRKRGKRCLRF